MQKMTNMTRLNSLSAELVLKLKHSSVQKLRSATLVACKFAISRTKTEHPILQKALTKIRTVGVLTAKEKAEIDSIVAQLDKKYFNLQEAAKEGQVSTDDYDKTLKQARAAAALFFAGSEDAFEEAAGSIYEAAATIDDKEELFTLIQFQLE